MSLVTIDNTGEVISNQLYLIKFIDVFTIIF